MKTRQYKFQSVFISDVHLGCKYCRAEDLLDFLRNLETNNLYLVGDIIDGWQLKKSMYWTDTYTFIIRRIAGMMKHGTKVYYVAGNHDEFLRKFIPSTFGHLELVDEAIHTTLKGERILIVHGDMFDQITIKAKWLYYLGDSAYQFAMFVNQLYSKFRTSLGLSYWSLSSLLKQNVKQAVNFINNFEHFIVKHTKENKCSSVICGHIHQCGMKNIEDINYYNCGDWVESCTALTEDFEGNISIFEYHAKV